MESADSSGLDKHAHELLTEKIRARAEVMAFMFGDLSDDDMYKRDDYSRRYAESVEIEITDNEDLYKVLPPTITSEEKGKKRKLSFDKATFSDLCDDLDASLDQVEDWDVAYLYVGTGLAANLLKERADRSSAAAIERLVDTLTEPDCLLTAITDSDVLDEKQRYVLEETVMHMDEERLAKVNMLRFAIGTLFIQPEEPTVIESHYDIPKSYEYRLNERLLGGLKLRLDKYDGYVKLMRFMGQPDFTAKRQFEETISELEIAGSFPMGWEELRTTLAAVR